MVSPKFVVLGTVMLFTLSLNMVTYAEKNVPPGNPFQALQDQIDTQQGQIMQLEIDLQAALGRIDALESDVIALQSLTQFFSVDNSTLNELTGPHLLITGANVAIRSGSGDTNDGGSLTGLGNLVIGYNEIPNVLSPGDRDGSHNLIIGRSHKFLSFGGLAAGHRSTISGVSASVSGGFGNTASGDFSSVSGGESNTASGSA